jgi:tetratricopeptide (TPR) repeat protein
MGIERYRAIVRLEEIRSFMEMGEYEAAKETADSIRKERIKDSSDLFLLASVYRKCGEYATAKEYLLRIYEKKVNWRVLEELMEVCLAEKKPEEAETYLNQYAKLSGGDPRSLIYEYRIGRQKHRPDEELLPLLQTLKAESKIGKILLSYCPLPTFEKPEKDPQ